MTARFDRKYAGAAVVMVAGIVALMALSLQTVGKLRESMVDIDRAHDVPIQTQRITATLLDLVASQRGYLLTQEARYLETYRDGLARLDAELDTLSSTTANRPDLAANLQRLHELVDAKRAELVHAITLAETRGAGAALIAAQEQQSKALMNDISQALSHLEALEGVSQSRRQAEHLAFVERNEQFVRLLTAALALMIVALYALLRHDRALQKQIRRDEASSRGLLERRVKERTTELEAAARSLALSEERLRAIFDSATEGILTTDASQIIVEANLAAARMFRCAVTDLVGTPLERLVPARHREAHRLSVQAFGAGAQRARRMGGADIGRVVTAQRFDGQEFPIEASISRVDVDGQRLYTVVHRDITERLESEAALTESRSRLEAALGSMTDAVFISDDQGRLVEFNDAFATFHRFPSRDECRRTVTEYPEIFDVSLPDGTPTPLDQWPVSRALRGEAASSVEYRLRRKDTGESWVGSYSFAPIRARDGGVVGSVVSCRDISHIRQAQADLADSHRALQDLIANQQHVQEDERKRIARELHDDLQQSLAAIRMDAMAVGERVAKGRGDIEPLLTRIDKLSGAAIASTRRIVGDLRPELLEELGLVAALEAMCVQHAERTGSDCRLEVSAAAAEARLDSSVLSTGLYRITQEALNNVAKHARARTVRVELDCTHDGQVVLRVGDDGIGMRASDKHDPGSFGLQGMAERVRALGGQMRIEAQIDKGTMIEVLAPILVPDPAGARLAKDTPAIHTPARGQAQAPVSRKTWEEALQTVIDALAGHVAVLDESGVIRLVNTAWREVAAPGGDPGLQGARPGVNYLQACVRGASSDPSTQRVLEGLRAIMEGRDTAFMTEYARDTPGGRRWFRMHAASIAGGMALVTHIDITRRPEPVAPASGEAKVPIH